MPATLILLVALGLAGVAFVARPLFGFTATLFAVFLVPAALRFPHAPQLLTFPRIVMGGLLLGLLRQIRKGNITTAVFRPGRLHLAYAAFLVVSLILGVGLADPFANQSSTTAAWFGLFDPALFFVLCVACIRVIDDSLLVLSAVALTLTLSAVIAVVEHWSGGSWSHWWFDGSTLQHTYTGAANLQTRNGQVRVRAAADYAVAFAWLSAALIPSYLLLASRIRDWRRYLVYAGLATTLIAIYWSYTRSVLVGLVVIFAVIGPLARNMKITQVALVLVVGGALLGLAQPGVSARFNASVDQHSIDARNERNPLIIAKVSAKPVTGLGFTALELNGFGGADEAYVSLYAAIGATGLACFALFLFTALGTATRGLRSGLTTERLASACAIVGMLAILVGAAAFDAFTSTAAGREFALLAAIGFVAGEPDLGPAKWRLSLRWWRFALIPLALVIGLTAARVAPEHVAARIAFKSMDAASEAAAEPAYTGQELLSSVCEVIRAEGFSAGIAVQCRQPNVAPGFGELYITAQSSAQILQAAYQIAAAIGHHGVLTGFKMIVAATPVSGRSNIARTAPIWLTILAAGAALFLPDRRRRPPGPRAAPFRAATVRV